MQSCSWDIVSFSSVTSFSVSLEDGCGVFDADFIVEDDEEALEEDAERTEDADDLRAEADERAADICEAGLAFTAVAERPAGLAAVFVGIFFTSGK
jgi:hypothetical protein